MPILGRLSPPNLPLPALVSLSNGRAFVFPGLQTDAPIPSGCPEEVPYEEHVALIQGSSITRLDGGSGLVGSPTSL